MTKKVYNDLYSKAEEFVSIEKMVNDSSRVRKSYSEEAIKLIKQSIEIGEVLNHEIEIISKANNKWRDQDNIVLNTCIILNSNLKNQKEIIDSLKNNSPIDTEILYRLEEKINDTLESIDKALLLIQKIIQKDNEIILMDNLIINRKQFQKDSSYQLKKLALKTLEDAVNAVSGSSSNLDRGLQMIERLKKVRQFIDDNNKEELINLIDEASMGWNIATNVNKSSISQLEFTEKVNLFTKKLHEDSNTIKDLVVAKHDIFYENLELIAELTVILSLELTIYLEIKEYIDTIDYDMNLPKDIRDLISNLLSYVNIACKDIDNLANLNYDMTDSINLNADLENKSVDLTNMELEYFDQIKEEVNSMTESTKYPIEGSQKNITNGRLLEKYLQDIVHSLES